MDNAPERVTTIALALRPSRNVYYIVDHPNYLVEIAGNFTHLAMSKLVRIIQLNVRKQSKIHNSLINDKEITNAVVIAIQEPQAQKIKGQLLTTPMVYHKWTKIVPLTYREEGR